MSLCPNESNLATTPELTFNEVLLASQQKWKDAKQTSIERLPTSQAIDIPLPVSNLFIQLLANNLPSYLPGDTKSRIEDLPPPIISMGTIADDRFFINPPQFTQCKNMDIPEHEIAPYDKGINLLNEIGTDSLAEDILATIARKNILFKPLAAYLRLGNPIKPSYRNGVNTIKQIFADTEKFDTFRKSLSRATLSGETSELDRFLSNSGQEKLDRFAVELGNNISYGNSESRKLKTIDRSGFISGSLAAGFIHDTFPGVIFLPQAASLIGAAYIACAIRFAQDFKFAMVTPVTASINTGILSALTYIGAKPMLTLPHIITHEATHYISKNMTHWGLKQVKYNQET
jgi:hypothetical protein